MAFARDTIDCRESDIKHEHLCEDQQTRKIETVIEFTIA